MFLTQCPAAGWALPWLELEGRVKSRMDPPHLTTLPPPQQLSWLGYWRQTACGPPFHVPTLLPQLWSQQNPAGSSKPEAACFCCQDGQAGDGGRQPSLPTPDPCLLTAATHNCYFSFAVAWAGGGVELERGASLTASWEAARVPLVASQGWCRQVRAPLTQQVNASWVRVSVTRSAW